MSHRFGWLPEQTHEDALHSERLLFIEEKPFQRVTRRLLGEESLLRNIPRQLPSPPPEDDETQEDAPKEAVAQPISREKFRQDVLIDFAALESSIIRIQLIHSSNERERERYANEKNKILASSQAVKDNTIVLRAQLAEAQRILELRKGYDGLASKILDDKKLKSREEARQDIAALEKDIAELQAEGRETEALWAARKEGFERVVEEGKAYMRAIKGIKDQPDAEAEAEDEEMGDAEDDRQLTSTVGTPRPDGSYTPRHETGNNTPLPALEETDQANDLPAQSKLRVAETADNSDDTKDDSIAEPDSQFDADQPGEAMEEDDAVAADQTFSAGPGAELTGEQTVIESMDET